ncbi:MAG TPA: c-type cytochrome, partial [Methylomirabilota bacterium]|nr:c-type cytochrome [Methylomirabilota bacterium]
RVIRTRWRVTGVVPGLVEGGGRPSGYFTGATGLTIYRGDALGAELSDDAFIADCGSNLVHRKKLRPVPGTPQLAAERPEDEAQTEFLASTDNWFRPVQLANGPDGALYLADMYREVIEHPWSLPPGLKKHLDLDSGRDRGRIYRIVPEGFRRGPTPKLSALSPPELIALLRHSNGWHRETATRLLFEQAPTNLATLARAAWSTTSNAAGQILLLSLLQDRQALHADDLARAWSSPHAPVRRHAIRLLEELPPPEFNRLATNLAPLGRDAAPEVRFQLALSLTRLAPPERLAALTELLATTSRTEEPSRPENAGPDWILAAVTGALGGDAAELIERMIAPDEASPPPANAALHALTPLLRLVGTRNRSDEVARVMASLVRAIPPSTADDTGDPMLTVISLTQSLADGLREAGNALHQQAGIDQLAPVFFAARQLATNAAAAVSSRLSAIRLLADDPRRGDAETTLLWLTARRAPDEGTAPAIVHGAAARSLLTWNSPAVSQRLIDGWDDLAPAAKQELIEALLIRSELTPLLASALKSGVIPPDGLSALQLSRLASHANPVVRGAVAHLVPQAAAEGGVTNRLAFYAAALPLEGTPARGRTIFESRCAPCHQMDGLGFRVGPDLATVRAHGREKLLQSIIDPNREVAPPFAAHRAETTDGEVYDGLLASQNETAVTLRLPGGTEVTLPRTRLRRLIAGGRSLMPEGLEAGLDAQDMADLLEFLLRPEAP